LKTVKVSHAYDGHIHDTDVSVRQSGGVRQDFETITELKDAIEKSIRKAIKIG